jgi:hypothetical protein
MTPAALPWLDDPVWPTRTLPVVEDRAQLRSGSVQDGDAAAAERLPEQVSREAVVVVVGVHQDRCRGSLGDKVPQGAGLHALLPEAGEHVGDVAQVGLMRTDEQHAAPAVTEARFGVEEVGGTVQGDDGLARTRTAVDDESAAGSRADDGVLVGRDGAEYVSHLHRPAAAQAGDEGGLVVERGVPFEPTAPHERWAELAKRMRDMEQACDGATERRAGYLRLGCPEDERPVVVSR